MTSIKSIIQGGKKEVEGKRDGEWEREWEIFATNRRILELK